MVDRLDFKINVQIRPVQMMGLGQGDVEDLADRRVSEPRERLEGQEHLAIFDQHPKPVLRHVGDFNREMFVPDSVDFIFVFLDQLKRLFQTSLT